MSYTNLLDQNESPLIPQASGLDLEAFNALVLKYQDLVYNHAYALLGDHHAAEDATQESFIKAFKNLDNFRGESFRAWILRITTNTCYDELRKSKRFTLTALYPQNNNGEEVESPAWIVDPDPSPQATLEHKEFSHHMYRMLDELPAKYRSTLTLVDVHGLDYAEAAQALDIPLGTLKSRLARARFLMRCKLSNQFDRHTNFVLTKPASLCA
jgi:RNA polymerase sigma-70 factor (ECF subfamily)